MATIAGVPRLLAASTTDASVNLEPNREYTVQHLGFNVSGSADEVAIFLGIDQDAVATYAVGPGKAVLQNGKAIVIGPQCKELHFIVASGAPTFQVIPSPKLT